MLLYDEKLLAWVKLCGRLTDPLKAAIRQSAQTWRSQRVRAKAFTLLSLGAGEVRAKPPFRAGGLFWVGERSLRFLENARTRPGL